MSDYRQPAVAVSKADVLNVLASVRSRYYPLETALFALLYNQHRDSAGPQAAIRIAVGGVLDMREDLAEAELGSR